MSVLGHARVNTGQHLLEAQRDALNEAGCERVFTDQLSRGAVREDRPGLGELPAYVRAGDMEVVVALDVWAGRCPG